jgi:hypothetical protein
LGVIQPHSRAGRVCHVYIWLKLVVPYAPFVKLLHDVNYLDFR